MRVRIYRLIDDADSQGNEWAMFPWIAASGGEAWGRGFSPVDAIREMLNSKR